jgi:hypothetical protein
MKLTFLRNKPGPGGAMKKQIISFIDELKSNKKLATFDEASTKQAVVLRLLSFLGWDIFNVEEVYPDYAVGTSNVSYALRTRNTNRIFIEVKRVHKSLDNHQKALVNLGTREGVNMVVLTNGITWWFYLMAASGSWQQKWFYTIDIIKQKPDAFVTQLINLLDKDKVTKGQSLKAAKSLFQEKKQKLAADFLPEAWNQVLSQPNKIFVELLSDTTEKLCRYKVDTKTVEEFLRKRLDNWLIKTSSRSGAAPPSINMEATQILDLDTLLAPSEEREKPSVASRTDSSSSGAKLSTTDIETIKLAESYADKSIQAFSFNGNTYQVKNWVDMLTTLCDYFASTHNKDFEKVLWISNDQKARFSRYGDQLRIPIKVKRTDIYVETKLNPDEVVKTSAKLLAEFGYTAGDLEINAF